ncbi:hypothetical protein NAI74_10705, partial [Francisella tularensis subsp. holarctica]|nr:hypothetical protein [Francisella tularensis subsp. holarctica]
MADVMLNSDQINKVHTDIITRLVRESLAEDIAPGDITAQLADDIVTSAFCITSVVVICGGQDVAPGVRTPLAR